MLFHQLFFILFTSIGNCRELIQGNGGVGRHRQGGACSTWPENSFILTIEATENRGWAPLPWKMKNGGGALPWSHREPSPGKIPAYALGDSHGHLQNFFQREQKQQHLTSSKWHHIFQIPRGRGKYPRAAPLRSPRLTALPVVFDPCDETTADVVWRIHAMRRRLMWCDGSELWEDVL